MCNCGKTRQTNSSSQTNYNVYTTNNKNQTSEKKNISGKDFEKAYRQSLYGRSK